LRIGFYYEEDALDLELFDCYIMPAWHFDPSPHTGSFDCSINVQSMQEMNQYHIDYYLSLFNTILKEGGGIAYLSNEKDYIFQGEWTYPKNWKLLLKTRTPRSWTRNSPTEVFLKSAGSFEKENRWIDFMYSLQLQEFDRSVDQLKTIASLQGELQKKEQAISNVEMKLQQSQQEISSLRLESQKRREEVSSLQRELQRSHQEISSLQLELRESQQEVARLSSILLRMPLGTEEPTVEKAEQSLQALNDYYRSEGLPEIIQVFGPVSRMTAHLVLANLYLRRGRYRTALSHFLKIARMDPLTFLSIQAIKIIGNGLMVSLKRPQNG
jgi:tetratricopeptide (TPR) repeat protein